MKNVELLRKNIDQKIGIIRSYDTEFIITLLKLAERDGKNRNNDEDFYLLDHELERRAIQNARTIYFE
jgi:hypothetical protein